jgi:hypothetical protein
VGTNALRSRKETAGNDMTRRQLVAHGAGTAFVIAGATRAISASIARAVAGSTDESSDAAVTRLREGRELFQRYLSRCALEVFKSPFEGQGYQVLVWRCG